MHQNQKVYQESVSKLKYIMHKNSGAKTAVFLIHGYGASMYDLFDLHHVLKTDKKMDWYFPHGPIDLAVSFGMLAAAWFPIDMKELERCMSLGIHRRFDELYPREFEESLEKCKVFIENLAKDYDNVIIGGFSQGAMLSSHVSLKVKCDVKKVLLLSSNLIGEQHLKQALKDSNNNFSVFQSHGHNDNVLGLDGAKALAEIFKNNDYKISFNEFKGAHEIPMSILQKCHSFLKEN